MALTKSLITETVFGNRRVLVWDVTPDAAATSFTATANPINFVTVTAQSAVTDATFGVFTENAYEAGTAAVGVVAMTSVVTSGEIKYRVMVYA